MATHYPVRRGVEDKAAQWTENDLKALTAECKGHLLGEAGGMVGTVKVSRAGKLTVGWEWAFKDAGKMRRHWLGTWPEMPIKKLREERDAARLARRRDGINPIQAKKVGKAEAQAELQARAVAVAEDELTLKDLFEKWIERVKRSPKGMAELRKDMERDLLAAHGAVKVKDLRDSHFYSALDAILARRKAQTVQLALKRGLSREQAEALAPKRPGWRMADKSLTTWRQMMSWANERKPWRKLMADGNPIAPVKTPEVLPNGAVANVVRKRVLSAEEVTELWGIFVDDRRRYEMADDRRRARKPMKLALQAAVWLSLSTLTRINSLMQAEWRHVDLQARQWFIPAKNQKQTPAQKREPYDLVIELSDFACYWFARLKEETGLRPYCFPDEEGSGHLSNASIGKSIRDRQAMFAERTEAAKKGRAMNNDLVLAGGANGVWGPHDCRRTGATLMEGLGIGSKTIARCLGHVTDELPGKPVPRGEGALGHYLHHTYRDEMRAAFDRLGKRLEALTAPRLVKAA